MKDYFCTLNNNEKIYIDICFADYNSILLFFLCKSNKRIYIVENIDVDGDEFYIAQTSYKNIKKMLNQEITMRDIMLDSNKKYHLLNDNVYQIEIFDSEWLPYENSKIKFLDSEVSNFKNKLNKEI